jgi:spore maturation protein SpmA
MLNYIWAILIFLGFVSAIYYDSFDSATSKYRNDVAIQSTITSDSVALADNKLVVILDSNTLTKHFGVPISVSLKGEIPYNSKLKGTESSVNFKVPAEADQILKEIAKSSGKDDDITAIIKFNEVNGTSIKAAITFESVSLRKIKEVTNAAISYAGTAVEIALGLVGIMALWLGIMKIAEAAGIINYIAIALRPVTKRLFPDVPHDHPAIGSIIMNISANFLGLSNAATPFGLKAMEELDKLNPVKGTATNAMCTFLAINTAGMTLIPATAIAVRAASGSTQPAVIIGTSLFASACATTAGLVSVKIMEKFSLNREEGMKFLKVVAKKSLFVIPIVAIIFYLFFSGIISLSGLGINTATLKTVIDAFSALAIPLIIFTFVLIGLIKKVKVYETFIDGAKEGFNVALKIIPYLVAMLVAIGIFRGSGGMDLLVWMLTPLTNLVGMPAEALPMALMRPLSGSGSIAIMTEIIKTHGPDSLLGLMVSTFFGSTETTFYVLAVYFGSVNIKRTRHALPAGLIADVTGLLMAVFIVRLLFG